ncbi:MAG: GAF domain-containing protein [Gammaproteobacteria bacterium]
MNNDTAHALPLAAEHPYATLWRQAHALLEGQSNAVANAANLSALIFNNVADLNWAGFYFLHGDTLIVGPFQGQPACVEIPMGSGVCGTSAANNETLRVADVHQFDGHIACDAASQSEIVVPLVDDTGVYGVLDIDSPKMARFTAVDQEGFEALAALYTQTRKA